MQVISGVYDHSNVPNDAIQDENRNPYVQDPGAQTLGIEKVVPCPDIPEAPASPSNIIHHEPINWESKLHLESLIAECDVDYLLKNQVSLPDFSAKFTKISAKLTKLSANP